MVRVYATQFPIDGSASLDDFMTLSKEWVAHSPHNGFSISDLDTLKGHGDVVKSGIHRVESGQSLETRGEKLIETAARRYTNPNNGGDIWTTDLVGGKLGNKFWASVVVDHKTTQLDRPLELAKKPFIVKHVLENLGGGYDGMFKLTGKPYHVHDCELDKIAKVMTGRGKTMMPVIYVSRDINHLTFPDPNYLARRLRGVAHVLVGPSSPTFKKFLKEETGGINAHRGGVGIYWPQGTRTILLDELFSKGVRLGQRTINDKIVNTVEFNMRHANLSGSITWPKIQQLHNADLIQSLRNKGGSSDELVDLLDKENDELKNEKHRLQQQVQTYEAALRQVPEQGQFTLPEMTGLYTGEIKDIFLDYISQSTQNLREDSRRKAIGEQFLEDNPVSEHRDKLLAELKSALHSERGMSSKLSRKLKDAGFEVNEQDKSHPTVSIEGFHKEQPMPASGSDVRGGKNAYADLKKNFF